MTEVYAATWTHASYCDALAVELDRIVEVTEGVDPELPVPTCPDWRLADLLDHVGLVHRWCTEMVRRLSPERLRRDDMGIQPPADRAGYPEWIRQGAGPLLEALRAADPDAAMWAWGPDRHVRFWPRRMLHETTVHRVDAELTSGGVPVVESSVAVDGVSELFTNLPTAGYFAPGVDELRGDGETIGFACTDVDACWTVRLLPDRFEWSTERAESPTCSLRGGSVDVLLGVYGRVPLDDPRYAVSGDRAVLDRWIEKSAI